MPNKITTHDRLSCQSVKDCNRRSGDSLNTSMECEGPKIYPTEILREPRSGQQCQCGTYVGREQASIILALHPPSLILEELSSMRPITTPHGTLRPQNCRIYPRRICSVSPSRLLADAPTLGTWNPFISTASIAASLLSMCDSVRRPPERSKQRFPEATLHVGQVIERKSSGVMAFILIWTGCESNLVFPGSGSV
jgi:hypothetical protein